jgi:hypothetical protein
MFGASRVYLDGGACGSSRIGYDGICCYVASRFCEAHNGDVVSPHFTRRPGSYSVNSSDSGGLGIATYGVARF